MLLVNAIYDGLNLVAKEAPLVNERDGVLILSENAGSHEELGPWALTVNPFDLEAQARAIDEAILMSQEERRARIESIREQVRSHDVASWLDTQLEDLDQWSARAARVRGCTGKTIGIARARSESGSRIPRSTAATPRSA